MPAVCALIVNRILYSDKPINFIGNYFWSSKRCPLKRHQCTLFSLIYFFLLSCSLNQTLLRLSWSHGLLPECKKLAFLAFTNFIFSRRGIPSDPLPFIYVPKGNSIPPEHKINNIYQTERFEQFEATISRNKRKRKQGMTRICWREYMTKEMRNCLYKTSFEKLSSVALGCRAGLSHSSFCECLLTSLFTFLLIRSRDQVLAIKDGALVQIKFKS